MTILHSARNRQAHVGADLVRRQNPVALGCELPAQAAANVKTDPAIATTRRRSANAAGIICLNRFKLEAAKSRIMLLVLKPGKEELGREAARIVANAIRRNPALRLGLATGSTTLGIVQRTGAFASRRVSRFFPASSPSTSTSISASPPRTPRASTTSCTRISSLT